MLDARRYFTRMPVEHEQKPVLPASHKLPAVGRVLERKDGALAMTAARHVRQAAAQAGFKAAARPKARFPLPDEPHQEAARQLWSSDKAGSTPCLFKDRSGRKTRSRDFPSNCKTDELCTAT